MASTKTGGTIASSKLKYQSDHSTGAGHALYIGATVYRIHGTNAPETIGQAVSSGCFRLVNEDVQDLFARVPVGTKVIVQHQ